MSEDVKDGLSILIIKSMVSKNGFLKSIGGGFDPVILKGPLGCGDSPYPIKTHWYSPPSLLLTVKSALDSCNELGSNLMLIGTSIPSNESHGPARIYY